MYIYFVLSFFQTMTNLLCVADNDYYLVCSILNQFFCPHSGYINLLFLTLSLPLILLEDLCFDLETKLI